MDVVEDPDAGRDDAAVLPAGLPGLHPRPRPPAPPARAPSPCGAGPAPPLPPSRHHGHVASARPRQPGRRGHPAPRGRPAVQGGRSAGAGFGPDRVRARRRRVGEGMWGRDWGRVAGGSAGMRRRRSRTRARRAWRARLRPEEGEWQWVSSTWPVPPQVKGTVPESNQDCTVVARSVIPVQTFYFGYAYIRAWRTRACIIRLGVKYFTRMAELGFRFCSSGHPSMSWSCPAICPVGDNEHKSHNTFRQSGLLVSAACLLTCTCFHAACTVHLHQALVTWAFRRLGIFPRNTIAYRTCIYLLFLQVCSAYRAIMYCSASLMKMRVLSRAGTGCRVFLLLYRHPPSQYPRVGAGTGVEVGVRVGPPKRGWRGGPILPTLGQGW